jgi:hypothetical protein
MQQGNWSGILFFVAQLKVIAGNCLSQIFSQIWYSAFVFADLRVSYLFVNESQFRMSQKA